MHLLQSILLPEAGFPEALYLGLRSERGKRALPDLAAGEGIPLQSGETLTTDTFLGAFHLAWWRAFTSVRSIAAVVTFRGRGIVRVFETSARGPILLHEAEMDAAAPQRHLVRFRPGWAGAASEGSETIHVEVEALRDSLVAAIEFVTDTPPVREATLSIGLSTFNDADSRIDRMLPDLVDLAAEDWVSALHVVNHGAPLKVAPSPKLVVRDVAVEAPAGGLSATLAAALEAPRGATHHLMLADDLVLDARLLRRIVPFLRFLRRDCVLGGAILDLNRPTHMVAAGAMLTANGQLRPVGAGLDILEADPDAATGARTPRQTLPFLVPGAVDYVPWWFAVVPLDRELIALPPGPFQRGDDYAAGLTLAQHGVAGLCLPGLAAWRDPGLTLPAPEDTFHPLSNRFLPLVNSRPLAPAMPDGRLAPGAGRLHILQHLLFPVGDLPESVFLRVTPARRKGQLVPRPTADGGLAIRLEPRHILSTDTFFGSFYRAYWRAWTPVRDLVAVVELSGRARIRVFEDTGRGVDLLIEERLSSPGRRRFVVDLPLAALEPPPGSIEIPASRLFIEIEAEAATDVHAVDICSPTPPLRQATLSIGLCTFNQEAYFARTLALIARLAEETPAIRAVYVVNQGNPFQSQAIRDLLQAPKITGIDQGNLGGCGGFTRSLTETLASPDPTSHHLMMDDDIVLDERSILRALRFLDYADKEIAVGAGMIDSLRPTFMYEAGAFLRNDNTIHPYCHNVDLADPGNLWYFNKPVDTDFNAWWFCILPVERSRSLKLPAPVFIRGDDFEYGQRLAKAGVPTVTLPGIGVWHEPFYAKPSGWQDYYDMRNRLIFGATYGDRVRQLSLAHVLGLITGAILSHNYMSAELRMRAVADFLAGPDRLFSRSPEELHREVMALAKADAPERLGADWKQRPIASAPPRPTEMRPLVRSFLRSLLRTGLGRLRDTDDVLMDATAHPGSAAGRSYVLTNGPRSFHLRFRPRRWRMWKLALRSAALGLRYRNGRAAAGEAWAKGIASYRDPGWWSALFAASTRKPEPKPAAQAARAAEPEKGSLVA